MLHDISPVICEVIVLLRLLFLPLCENTDAIMKNRFAILDALKVEGPVQENFRNSKYNEAAIEYLENRSLMNNRVAKTNEKMSEAKIYSPTS